MITSNVGPKVQRLIALIGEKYKLSKNLTVRALTEFGVTWAEDFELILDSLFLNDEDLDSAMKGYSAFSLDSMRRQKAFENVREYPKKTFAEAAGEVYFNEAHMMREYLPGLLLSHFLWLHHYRQLRFFDTAFLVPMGQAGGDTRFAEVGVGTAVYSRRILDRIPEARGTGFDISPFSCAFAIQHLRAAAVADRFTMNQQDIIVSPIEPVPWLVCVEVLEHLEQPVHFLKALRQGLAPGGKAFITAALNAAHADHIYLYRNAEEVLAHLEIAGFRLEQLFVAAAYTPPAKGVPVPLAAAFIVY
ncbi:MAG: methyltransferase [Rhodoferax sp.]|nr:methyltransferase [Rhodoferax sp.]